MQQLNMMELVRSSPITAHTNEALVIIIVSELFTPKQKGKKQYKRRDKISEHKISDEDEIPVTADIQFGNTKKEQLARWEIERYDWISKMVRKINEVTNDHTIPLANVKPRLC